MNTDSTRLALDRIERSQELFKIALSGAVVLESFLIGAMLLLVDFSDKLQALLFVSTIGSYTLVGLGLVMLAAHVDRTLLRAINLHAGQ